MNFINKLSNSSTFDKNDAVVSFDRKELGLIFNIYGKMVAHGEWRDYGISVLKEVSIFSIYKNYSECPIYITLDCRDLVSNGTPLFSIKI